MNDPLSFAPKQGSNLISVLLILVVALAGPLIGLLLARLGLMLAPPWTGLTGTLYPFLACLGLPLALLAATLHRLRTRGMLMAVALSVLAGVFMLVIVGPALPGGMTDCQPAAAGPSEVRYNCVSTSSDDASERYTFILEGWPDWPIMHSTQPQR